MTVDELMARLHELRLEDPSVGALPIASYCEGLSFLCNNAEVQNEVKPTKAQPPRRAFPRCLMID